MKGRAFLVMCFTLLVTSCMSIAQKLDTGDYYTVLPQAIYTIPGSNALIKTTVCTTGTEPGFGQELNTPGFNGVAGTRSYHVKTFPAPEGYTFYKMTIQLEKSTEEVSFDINKTFITTNTGSKAYPYYALPLIAGHTSLEEDLLKQQQSSKPFVVTFPKGKTQKYIEIWYATLKTETPVSYNFFSTQCEVKKYIRQ